MVNKDDLGKLIHWDIGAGPILKKSQPIYLKCTVRHLCTRSQKPSILVKGRDF